jgi:hypothetical protein
MPEKRLSKEKILFFFSHKSEADYRNYHEIILKWFLTNHRFQIKSEIWYLKFPSYFYQAPKMRHLFLADALYIQYFTVPFLCRANFFILFERVMWYYIYFMGNFIESFSYIMWHLCTFKSLFSNTSVSLDMASFEKFSSIENFWHFQQI